MSFLFSFFVLPFVLIGLLISAKDIYLFLKKTPKLGLSDPNKAGLATLIFAGLCAGLIASPHFITAAFGWFNYVLAVVYVTFIVVGLVRVWKWFNLVRRVEDSDPNNDPKFADDPKGDCRCPKKDADKAPPADGPTK